MLHYIIRRLLFIPITLFVIMSVNFMIVQVAPGGPVELMLEQIKGHMPSSTNQINGGSELIPNSPYRGGQGLEPQLRAELTKQFGFDQPPLKRFVRMIMQYLRFDFGQSFYKDQSVIQLLITKLPVSISLGLWGTLIIYMISIPLGIIKAVRDGSKFDVATSMIVVIGTAVPSFLFAILLIVLFAGGHYLMWFPLRGLISDNWVSFNLWHKVTDYIWHLILPVTALVIGGFASLTMLTKNCFLDEMHKQYVMTARAKGLTEWRVLCFHVFRNAMLLVIAGFPAALVGILFTGALLIEIIFSLDGIGLLGYEAVVNRDYPIVFGTLYMFSLIGLILGLISDLAYHWVDPRIDFSRRSD